MNARSVFRYHFSQGDLPGSQVMARLSDSSFHVSHARLQDLIESARAPSQWADDFLRIARAVFLADKKSLRDTADDGWTRTLYLTVELVEPEVWNRQAAELNELLTLLTGDHWQVTCVPGGMRHDHGRQPAFPLWEATEVALFSGGLDSTAYAASAMRAKDDPILLIAYHEPSEAPRQKELFRAIQRLGSRSVELRQLSQKVFGDGDKLELSSRSRGLLFVATAIYAASGHGTGSVIMPENGQLAINPPLTAARAAACSTRSVHPRTMESINRLIAGAGGDVEVVNPFMQFTKGDVCMAALRAGLPEDMLWRTVSCGRPPINRNGMEFHCGRCFPCLVRRSGLLQSTGKDLTPYEYDFRSLSKGTPLPGDLLALWRWLGKTFSTRDLIADLPLPADIHISPMMSVLRRGRVELIEMIRQSLPQDSVYLHEWKPCA